MTEYDMLVDLAKDILSIDKVNSLLNSNKSKNELTLELYHSMKSKLSRENIMIKSSLTGNHNRKVVF